MTPGAPSQRTGRTRPGVAAAHAPGELSPELETVDLEPARFLEAGGVSFHYRLEGRGSDAVVLLHEMGGTLESWDGIVQGLADQHVVLRYDQRGAGRSEKVRGDYGADAGTADLEAVVAALGLAAPLHVVAVAASCAVPLRFAQRHPGALTSQVLCNPAVGVPAARIAQLCERAELIEREGLRAGLDVTLGRSWPAGYGDAAGYAAYRARYLGNDPWALAQMNRALAESDADALISGVKVPTLVVAGRDDQVRPAATSEAFAARIPGARFATIASGHIMPAQAPAELLALLLEFFASLR